MEKEFKATIYYRVDELHPDYKYIPNPQEEQAFLDTYTFPEYRDDEDCIAEIKSDLRLIAGGGYNDKHIHDVRFEIDRI